MVVETIVNETTTRAIKAKARIIRLPTSRASHLGRPARRDFSAPNARTMVVERTLSSIKAKMLPETARVVPPQSLFPKTGGTGNRLLRSIRLFFLFDEVAQGQQPVAEVRRTPVHAFSQFGVRPKELIKQGSDATENACTGA